MKNFFNHFAFPTSLLVANIIGAGMFALPFVFYQSGLITGVLYLALFGILAALMHLIYADIVLRTKETHLQFPGYIRRYLGERTGKFANILVFVTLLFTLTAYLILSASFLRIIVPSLSPLTAMLIFWIFSSFTIFISIKRTAIFDTVTTAITLTAIGAIFIYWGSSVPYTVSELPILVAKNALLPFGPVLFSFIGFSAIPALIAYVRKESVPFANIRNIIVAGSLIPAFFYFLYVISVWGISRNVSPDSITGLLETAPYFALLALGILGFVSLWDSYSSVGRDINKLLEYDWRVPSEIALAIVVSAPLALYFLGFQNFITIVSAVGGILFSIWGILIILAWKKATLVNIPSVKFSTIYIPEHTYAIINDIPVFIINMLLFVFAGGIVYELFHFIFN